MSATLEKLLEHRARRLRMMRPYRIAKRPAEPAQAEKEYVADLRKLTAKWGDVAQHQIVPHLVQLAKARTDDVTSFNQFVVFRDHVDALAKNDVIVPLFQRQAAKIEKFTTRAVGESMGIPYSAFLASNTKILAPRLSDFVDANTDLITSLAGDYVQRVGSTLTAMQGARVEDISTALRRSLDITQSHADLIAVDQTLKLNSQITEVRQAQVGVVEYVWMTAHDERVRPDHVALDGTRHRWADEPPIVDRKAGRREHPGRDFRCRCQAIAVVPGFN